MTDATLSSDYNPKSSGFLNDLMIQDNNAISKDFFKLPDIAGITADNLNIHFDVEKQDSFLFYVENPISDTVGFYDELNVFVLKATPLCGKYVSEKDAQKNLDLNTTDGDTMYFDIQSLQDNNTAFKIHDKEYSSFKAFLIANNQSALKFRHVGYDAPEIIHYSLVPLTDNAFNALKITKLFGDIADDENYITENIKDASKQLTFIKCGNRYCQYIEDYEGITRKVVYKNDTRNRSDDYVKAGIQARNLMLSLLQNATDIRLVIDHQSLTRRASSYKDDELDDEGTLSQLFSFIHSMWTLELSDLKYRYAGYSVPGVDGYNRSLGAIYVKTYVSELKSEAWVNVGKYILYFTNQFSNITAGQTNNAHDVYYNNFLSPTFKLASYDKTQYEIMDRYTHETSKLLEERNAWYEKITGYQIDALREYTVILGDCVLTIPPINIRMASQSEHLKIPLLRSKGRAVKTLPKNQRLIELDIYFNGYDQINGKEVAFGKNTYYMNGLRSLVAMFKLTPFLPIENNYINQELKIEAVSLVHLAVSTVNSYPGCLKATLTLSEFDYAIYMPELKTHDLDYPFASTIHYPAMRWYYQRLLQAGNSIQNKDFNSADYLDRAYGRNTALVPTQLNHSFIDFYIPDQLQLESRLKLFNDPKPILTQDQFTPTMIEGAKKIKPLLEAIQKMGDSVLIEDALRTLFNPTYIDLPNGEGLYTSADLNSEAEYLQYNIPLYFLASEGSQKITETHYDTSTNIAIKTPVSYLSDTYIIPTVVPSFVSDVWHTQFVKVLKAFHKEVGLFGSIDTITCNITGSKNAPGLLTLTIPVPLPIELRESSYEIEVLAKKLQVQFGGNLGEGQSLLQYTEKGYLSIPIELSFPLKFFSTNESSNYYTLAIDTFNVLDKKHIENSLAIKILLYLNSLSDKTDSTTGSTTEDAVRAEKYDMLLNSATGLKFVKYNMVPILIEQASISYSNTFSQLNLKMAEGKGFQYCGGQDMQIQLAVTTTDKMVVEHLSYLPTLSANIAKDYRHVLNCWPLRIDCEFSKLFGVCETIIENVQTESVQNHPGVTRIILTISSVDRTVRQKEALMKIKDVPSNAGSTQYGTKGYRDIKGYFDLKNALSKAEVYPDLELPTIEELEDAGFKFYSRKDTSPENISWNRIFADPDFYFIYGQALACEIFRENFLKAFNDATTHFDKYDLTDVQGAFTKLSLNKGTLENANDIAIKQQAAYGGLLNCDYTYKSVTDEVFHSINDHRKAQYKLGETLATLGTTFWHFGQSAKLPFKEEHSRISAKSAIDLHRTKKTEILNKIHAMLAMPIEEMVPNLTLKELTADTSYATQIRACEEMCKEAIQHIKEYIKFFSLNQNIEDVIDTTTDYLPDLYQDIENILLALGDANSGENYYNDQAITIGIEKDSKVSINWRLKMFLTNDSKNLVPFARVEKPSQYLATSLEDAIENGVSFGPFGIKYYTSQEIKKIFPEEALNFNKRYFLDPYYRKVSDAILLEHKHKLLTSPGYSVLAAFREISILYAYYLQNEKLLSFYELIRTEVFTLNEKEIEKVVSNVPQYAAISGSAQNSGIISTQPNQTIIEQENEIFESYYEVLGAIATEKENDKAAREVIAYQVLNLSIDEPVAKAIVNGTTNITAATDKYKNLLKDAEQDKTTPTETLSRYKALITLCENYQSIDIPTFALDILEMRSLYSADTSFSQNIANDLYKQLRKDEMLMIRGRLIGVCCSLIVPSIIHPLMMSQNANALNDLIATANTPSITSENTFLRKFLNALYGRKVIDINNIGVIPETIESKYRNYIHQQILIERSENPKEYLRDSFFDMIHYDKRGRMLRAFPTYYMFFIDEGRNIGLWKLHDNFYSSTAIAEIEITKSRKIAADTAHIVLTNLFNSYTQNDKDFITDLDYASGKNIKFKIQESFNAIFSPMIYYNKEEKERLNAQEPITTCLMPGTRIHIRMGYGSNAADLPIVFNGQVAEIGNGEVVEIVAQGDGVELLNPIQDLTNAADAQNQEAFSVIRFIADWATNGATPKTILSTLLTTEGKWLDKKLKEWSKGYFNNRHPYGIAHFGDIYYTEIFKNSECVQNLFEVNSRAVYETQTTEYVGLENQYAIPSNAPIINMQIQNKTFWDIMHVCASTAPDYMCSIVPFEMRSSIFLGRGRDYYAYAYEQAKTADNTTYIREKRKPFEQYHYYTSYSDIIANNIVASNKFIKTNAVGLYSETGWFGNVKPKQTEPLFVDFSIFSENQRSTTVDTQLWAQGMPIVGNMFGFNSSFSKDVNSIIPGAKEIAWRMTASALKNTMKDMYQGDLIIMGDPSIKPFDRMLIQDVYENMQGACWVESVVHSFNAQTGFTTNVYADCINEIDDRYERQNDMLIRNALQTASVAYMAPVLLNKVMKSFNHINHTIANYIVKHGTKGVSKIDEKQLANMLMQFTKGDNTPEVAIKEANRMAKELKQYMLKTISFTGGQIDSIHLSDVKGIKEKTKTFFKNFVSSSSRTFSSVFFETFDNIGNKLVKVDKSEDLFKILKQLNKNGDILEEISPAQIKNVIKIKEDDVAAFNNALKTYGDDLTKAINKTITFDNTFCDKLEEMTVYTLDQMENITDVTGEHLKFLDIFLKEKKFTSAEDVKKLAKATEHIAKMCDNAELVKDVAKTIESAKHFDQIADVAKTVKHIDGLMDAIKLVGAASGPIGFIGSALLALTEVVLSVVIGAYATEKLERYLQNLQVMRIYPLSKNGRVMTAGLTGHKGLVVGSPTETKEDEWTKFVSDLFGAKKPDSLIESVLQGFLCTDRIRTIAKRYRTQNNMPDVLDSSIEQQDLLNNFELNFNKHISVLSSANELATFQLNRYTDLEKSITSFSKYLAKSESLSTTLTKETVKDFFPLISHANIKKQMDVGILTTLHTLNKNTNDAGTSIVYYEGAQIVLPIFSEGASKYNMPILRKDALIVLDMLLNIYVQKAELNVMQDNIYDRIKSHALTLTSCTIVNGEGYDATGYVFRITSQNNKILEDACYQLRDTLNENKYCINYIHYASEHIVGVAIPLDAEKVVEHDNE